MSSDSLAQFGISIIVWGIILGLSKYLTKECTFRTQQSREKDAIDVRKRKKTRKEWKIKERDDKGKNKQGKIIKEDMDKNNSNQKKKMKKVW